MARCLESNTKSYSSLLVWAWKAFPNEPFLLLGSQGFRWLCAGSHWPVVGPVDMRLFYASSQRHTAGNQAAVRPTLQSGTWAAAAVVAAAAWIHCPTPDKPEPGVRASPISHTQQAPGRRPIGSCTRVRWEGQGPPSLERDSFVRGAGRLLSDLHLLGSYICVLGRSARYYLAPVQTCAGRLCFPKSASNGVSWPLT